MSVMKITMMIGQDSENKYNNISLTGMIVMMMTMKMKTMMMKVDKTDQH